MTGCQLKDTHVFVKEYRYQMNVLMVGVDRNRIGGMWTVAETFINDEWFNKNVKLYYVATSTGGSKIKRVCKMIDGYFKVIEILASKKIDIVHIHMAEKGSVYRKNIVIKMAKMFGVTVVVQMHAGPILAWYESLPLKKQFSVSKILNSADRILVLGEYWKKQMVKIVNANKIEVLYNGAECPSQNLYNIDGKYILYMGVFKKAKGIYDLIDAIKIIDNQLPPDIKVYLCGMDENGKTKKYVMEHGLNNRIVMPGWIDKGTRLELFKNTQICVLPSYFEALSMTVIEAMCYGIPIVTTNISTMPELLGNKITLIQPGNVPQLANEILSLNQNTNLRMKMSNIEYQRAKRKFSVDIIMKKTINIYNSLINDIRYRV